MYLYYFLTTIFYTSREAKEAMISQVQDLKKSGLAKVTGENVELISLHLTAICRKLEAIRALHDDMVDDILMGLSICSYKPSGKLFDTLLQNSKLDNLKVMEGITATSTSLDKIEAILAKACEQYNKFCQGKLWNVHGKGIWPRCPSCKSVLEL